MKVARLRVPFFVLALLVAAAGVGFGQVRTSLTGEAVAALQAPSSAQGIVASFASANQPLSWGIGYEVVHRHFGFGGIYAGNFTRSTSDEWWFDWYGEAFYLSYHLFARRTLIDPFVTLGLGSAGRVYLGPAPTAAPVDTTLLLSIFPVASAGLGLDLDGLRLSLKVSYLPVISPPPATTFENVPIGRFFAVASAGVTIGR